jgi:uncharacterized protein (DUF1501 family)
MTEAKKISRRELIKQGGLALSVLALPSRLTTFLNFNEMTDNKNFDVIIVGGSYAGLSAAMSLGRALRNVLIIDSGLPCNRQHLIHTTSLRKTEKNQALLRTKQKNKC